MEGVALALRGTMWICFRQCNNLNLVFLPNLTAVTIRYEYFGALLETFYSRTLTLVYGHYFAAVFATLEWAGAHSVSALIWGTRASKSSCSPAAMG